MSPFSSSCARLQRLRGMRRMPCGLLTPPVLILFSGSRVIIAMKRSRPGYGARTKLKEEDPLSLAFTVLLAYSRLILVAVYTHLLLYDAEHQELWRWCVIAHLAALTSQGQPFLDAGPLRARNAAHARGLRVGDRGPGRRRTRAASDERGLMRDDLYTSARRLYRPRRPRGDRTARSCGSADR